MNQEVKITVLLWVMIWAFGYLPQAAEAGHNVLKVSENWRLAMQVYTFHRFTFEEAVEKSAAASSPENRRWQPPACRDAVRFP